MPWKPEYAENRRKKAQSDPEYRAKRNAQAARDPEGRKEYMAAYYKANPEKFGRRTPEQQAKYNESRRAKYAADPDFRDAMKAASKAWQDANPHKRKHQRLQSAFGIGLTDYQDMLALQQGRCAICGYSDMSEPKFFPVVDHDHKTGAVRGLLCMNCNQGLGKFGDNSDVLMTAAMYLFNRR